MDTLSKALALMNFSEFQVALARCRSQTKHVWALFVGHLCIEKLLKTCYVKEIDTCYVKYVKEIDTLAPRIHDLYKLALKCNLEMTEEQMDALHYVTLFNLEARYEEYKREFHKKCTKDFTAKNIKTIEGLRTWLREKITS